MNKYSRYEGRNAWSSGREAARREFPSGDPAALEIWGYIDRPSYRNGERVILRVHTTAPRYEVKIYHDAPQPRVVHEASNLSGVRQHTPEDAYARGCGWTPTHEFNIATDWKSGVYVIALRGIAADGRVVEHEHQLIVRPESPRSAMALVLTTATLTSYNDWGGANAYRRIRAGEAVDEPSPLLSMERPLGRGFVCLPPNAIRHSSAPVLARNEPPSYPWVEWAYRNGLSRHYTDAGWAYYERPFAHWAESAGFEFDYYSQHDLHADTGPISGYRAVAMVGHDEYWTWEMRDTIDRLRSKGGDYLRFGGNLIWQVRLEDDGRTQVCYKLTELDPLHAGEKRARTSTHWDWGPIGRPVAYTFGTTGLQGVYNRFGAAASRASGGLTVYRPHHWVFEGTDLYYGDVLGGGAAQIACFEVDGADYNFRGGVPYVTGVDGAPSSLEILAMTPASRGEEWRHGGPMNAPLTDVEGLLASAPASYPFSEHGSGMMVVEQRQGSLLFNSGTSEWVSGLIARDEQVEIVTRNVLTRAISSPALRRAPTVESSKCQPREQRDRPVLPSTG